MNHQEDRNEETLIEGDDWIEVHGVKFNKPVVEKPVDAEDHNIYIYYPLSAGGGSKRLHRKVGNKSSEFFQHENEVRRQGSYIYEECIETQGVDVKVYTVGPHYGHAEARKSPVVDGKVNRNDDGSEVRYPVILSPEEKHFANTVCRAFKQGVCGFDILRVHGKSYVCDVNGWSFVKTSKKYFDDCAQLDTFAAVADYGGLERYKTRRRAWLLWASVAAAGACRGSRSQLQHRRVGVASEEHVGAGAGRCRRVKG